MFMFSLDFCSTVYKFGVLGKLFIFLFIAFVHFLETVICNTVFSLNQNIVLVTLTSYNFTMFAYITIKPNYKAHISFFFFSYSAESYFPLSGKAVFSAYNCRFMLL